MKKIIIYILLIFLSFQNICAFSQIQNPDFNSIIETKSTKNLIIFNNKCQIKGDELFAVYSNDLGLGNDDEMKVFKVQQDSLGFKHYKYQQKYKGIEIEGAVFIVHEKNGIISKANGNLATDISFNIYPSIQPNQALTIVLDSVNAITYMWEDTTEEKELKTIKNDLNATYYPKHELIIKQKVSGSDFSQNNLYLAYRFSIYTKNPMGYYVAYIDAITGVLTKKISSGNDFDEGTGCTRYNGTQTINTTYSSPDGYYLYDGIVRTKYYCGSEISYKAIYDSDNNWDCTQSTSVCPSITNPINVVVSPHWAAERTFEYYNTVYGLNSYDGQGSEMLQKVHWARGAHWYPNGIAYFGPAEPPDEHDWYVSLDCVAHEWSHAVSYTAIGFTGDIDRYSEIAAIFESFSDIMGTMVEFYVEGTNGDWLVGEDFWDPNLDGYTRDMSNPNLKPEQPGWEQSDTYMGQYWDNYFGDCHFRCGVQNYWFYLLSEGGTGINDNEIAYNIEGIGKNSAAKIAYRTFTNYITPSSTYADARTYSIQAAIDLYGDCSNEVLNVKMAWCAVGVYDQDIDYQYYTVSTDENWTISTLPNPHGHSPNLFINNSLVISENKKLTIGPDINLFFGVDGKIIVEKGAALIIDGATLTNSKGCNNSMWQGIRVSGDEQASQHTAGTQGIVVLNGATIENAEVAIKTIGIDANGNEIDNSYGGIILANGANFINNKIAVQFYPYNNFNPFTDAQVGNLSCFKNCTFETTNAMYENGYEPEEFVLLEDVKGISFTGNTFINSASSNYSWARRGKGIVSYNASFTVKPICSVPCITPDKNTFEGLYYAIDAGGYNPLIPVTIKESEFANNFRGITIKGINNASITGNNFDVGGRLTTDKSKLPTDPNSYGVYLEGCTGYSVHDNEFTTTHDARYGIIVNNSGSQGNLINNNSFSNIIKAAIQAEKINGSKKVSGTTGTGLVFKCNKFANNPSTDIAVTSGRIAPNQGSTTTPAGNLFFSQGYPGNLYANPITEGFTYNYHTPEIGYNTLPVVSVYCPQISLYPCGIVYNPNTSCVSASPISTMSELMATISTTSSEINTLSALFDGGNAADLIEKIATPSINSGQLMNYLLAASPYLSDTVIISSLNRPQQMTPGHIKDVLVPNSPLTDNVMQVLTQKTLPSGIRKQIIDAQTGISQRTLLEQQIEAKSSIVTEATNALIKSFTSDTISTGIDSIIAFFKTVQNPEAIKIVAEAYTLEDNCTELYAVLNNLTAKSEEDQNFITYYKLLAGLCSSGKTIYELTPVQLQTIKDVASSGTLTSVNARVLLSIADTSYKFIETIEDIQIPDSLCIRGGLYENPDCGHKAVAGDTLVFKDELGNIVETITPAVTDESGNFRFDPVEVAMVDSAMLYTISTKNGFSLDAEEFRTTKEWLQESSLYLTHAKVNIEWQKEYGQDDSLYTMNCKIDLNGNIYILGTGTQTPDLKGGSSINLLKFDPSGTLKWAKIFDGDGFYYWATGLSVDSEQNVYVTGNRSAINSSYSDIVTIKYDSSGTKLWEKFYNRSGVNSGSYKSITDNYGNTYITGIAGGTYAVNFILKYDDEGSLIWARDIDATISQVTNLSVTKLDREGNLYVVGNYENRGSFILKCNSSGIISLIDTVPDCTLNAIETSPDGNVYVAGNLITYLDSVTTVPACYTAKYNNAGVLQWETKFVEEGDVVGCTINGLVLDSLENVVVAGSWGLGFSVIKYDKNGNEKWSNIIPGNWYQIFTYSDLDIDHDGNIYLSSTIGTLSAGFIANNMYSYKFSPDGSKLWEINTAGASTDIDVSLNENIYVVGTNKVRYFDPPTPLNPSRTFRTYYSLVLNKYSQCYSHANLKALGIQDSVLYSNINYLTVYPNPNDGTMNIEYNIPVEGEAVFEMYDLLGKKIVQRSLGGGNNLVTITESDLNRGIYYYRAIMDGNQIASDKLVIIK